MTFQSLIWRIRWTFDKRWRASTKARYVREHKASLLTGKLLRMTALRRFVAGRLATKKLDYLDRTYPS